MNNCVILLALTFLTFGFAETTTISVSGRKLIVDGKQFFAKGVSYGVTPAGQWGDSFDAKYAWDWQSSPSVYMRDIPLMKEMGVNTIRTYRWRTNVNHTAFLDECYKNGIYVAVGWQWNWNDYATDAGKQKMKDDLVNLIKNDGSHPAVIMWVLGNELNLDRGYQPDVWDFIKQLVALAHATEKNLNINWHPCGSPLADGNGIYDIMSARSDAVDVWMAQTYRGKIFYDFFTRVESSTTLPLFITEYGVDSYIAGASTADGEQEQSDWVVASTIELTQNSDICSGAYVFMWADDWGKCGGSNLGGQDLCPSDTGNRFPGGQANPEYFGIMAIQKPVADGGDVLRKKAVFYGLKSLFTNTSLVTFDIPEDNLDQTTDNSSSSILTVMTFAFAPIVIAAMLGL